MVENQPNYPKAPKTCLYTPRYLWPSPFKRLAPSTTIPNPFSPNPPILTWSLSSTIYAICPISDQIMKKHSKKKKKKTKVIHTTSCLKFQDHHIKITNYTNLQIHHHNQFKTKQNITN
ncbi:hypothetical protein Hanom_Chr12g01165121 [Helianthus anomalus]